MSFGLIISKINFDYKVCSLKILGNVYKLVFFLYYKIPLGFCIWLLINVSIILYNLLIPVLDYSILSLSEIFGSIG